MQELAQAGRTQERVQVQVEVRACLCLCGGVTGFAPVPSWAWGGVRARPCARVCARVCPPFSKRVSVFACACLRVLARACQCTSVRVLLAPSLGGCPCRHGPGVQASQESWHPFVSAWNWSCGGGQALQHLQFRHCGPHTLE